MAKSPTANPNLNPNLEECVHHADEILSRTDELEKRVQRVVQFYEDNGSSEEPVQSKRMQYLMRQFRNILSRIMNHKWAFPFLKPVDAVALGLNDYHEVIRKPMDLGTILNRMKANDECSRYKNIRDICADVRLVFTNAMQYNDPGTHVHTMAQALSCEFEKMWYPLSLQVAEEERRQQEREEQEAAIEKLTQDTEEELMGLSMQLDDLRKQVRKSCRKLSILEKRMLSNNFTKLSNEDAIKALKIAAKYDPEFDISSDCVEIDLNSMVMSIYLKSRGFLFQADRAGRDQNCTYDAILLERFFQDLIAQWMLFNFIEKCIKEAGKGAAVQQTKVEIASNKAKHGSIKKRPL